MSPDATRLLKISMVCSGWCRESIVRWERSGSVLPNGVAVGDFARRRGARAVATLLAAPDGRVGTSAGQDDGAVGVFVADEAGADPASVVPDGSRQAFQAQGLAFFGHFGEARGGTRPGRRRSKT